MAKSLNEQAKEIIKLAEESGAQSNFFFLTTFKRYQVQLNILASLEKEINEGGAIVTKEYVRGRANVYTNPAIRDYNRTTDSANKTTATLMRILHEYGMTQETPEDDPLLKAIQGVRDDDD